MIVHNPNKCGGCQICIDTCPNHAILIGIEGIVIDQDACLECGKCVEACPMEALSND